eukprot:tig00021318_g20163.t1
MLFHESSEGRLSIAGRRAKPHYAPAARRGRRARLAVTETSCRRRGAAGLRPSQAGAGSPAPSQRLDLEVAYLLRMLRLELLNCLLLREF